VAVLDYRAEVAVVGECVALVRTAAARAKEVGPDVVSADAVARDDSRHRIGSDQNSGRLHLVDRVRATCRQVTEMARYGVVRDGPSSSPADGHAIGRARAGTDDAIVRDGGRRCETEDDESGAIVAADR